MKTAYIITMHCPLNYGAILQTYALQKYLESLKLKVCVIDYRPNYIVYDQSLFYVGGSQYKKNILTRCAYRVMKAPSKIMRRISFANFANSELNLTKRFYTYEEICKAKLEADYFICGSDQIWNTVSGSYKDPAYFLDFVQEDDKKISYAASGNLPLTDEVKSITIPMINRIARISMREDSTIATVSPFVNKPIAHVCDPVFLLDPEDWRNLYKCHESFSPKERYILVYPMGNGGENTIENAYQIARQNKLPLYMVSASSRHDSRIDKQFNVSPYTFLSLIDKAEFVVTNSFHGTSFSIIFKKQFLTCVAEGSNQRIVSLLHAAGLDNHICANSNTKHGTYFSELSDKEDNRFSTFIEQSKHFIKQSVGVY